MNRVGSVARLTSSCFRMLAIEKVHHENQEPDTVISPDFQRIYVGILDYFVKPADVEVPLVETYLGNFQKIHFPSHQEATYALEALASKSTLGRVLKLGPCGWGDWKGADDVQEARKDGYSYPHRWPQKMVDQEHKDAGIRVLFEGFEMVDQRTHFGIAIGKRVIIYSLRSTPGRHHHCYADLASRAELNGAAMNRGVICVSIARDGRGPNQHVRLTTEDIMQQNNWRRVGDT
ncbi:hypothetical protein QBC36DRAFT_390647 [Triangularia setosa]|uniref:Uncharacterized protein n=1 Tax=Triangularia setosa TaxID=2587417 RepID=A0AAN6VYK7_9PEZI|nr:hypothetical protein QBC36DRAFT_390647 [Podospora setosa]